MIANINPATAFDLQILATIAVFIMTLFNLYHFFKGHRHNAEDIDVTITNPKNWETDFKEKRSLDKLWVRLLEHLKLKLVVNTEPREDIIVEDTKLEPPKAE